MNYHQEWRKTFVYSSDKFRFDVYNQDGLKHFRKHDKVYFMERTNEWAKTQENQGTFIFRQEYTVNGVSYVVDGKHVKLKNGKIVKVLCKN